MTSHRPLSDLINYEVTRHDDPHRWQGKVVEATDEQVRIEWPDETREWVRGRDVMVVF